MAQGKIHILGICGTFMAGLAILAKQQGYQVTGADEHVYPPMSTLLAEHNIEIFSGYQAIHCKGALDAIIIGNAMRRGNPAVEYILDQNLPFYSGPQWLSENILKGKHVLAVAGTHGKTTTSSMLAWMLDQAGLNPGFLIGGVPENFSCSARLTDSPYFVIEADEYDSAFFDKRAKFIHYHPRTLIINNLDYDHADIYKDLDAIITQFHHLIKTIPEQGVIIYPSDDSHVQLLMERGCWSRQIAFPHHNRGIIDYIKDKNTFTLQDGHNRAHVHWSLLGMHNVKNACAAMLAASQLGVDLQTSANALKTFKNVKRRMQRIACEHGVNIYDDFAHHPTAIEATLAGLRAHVGKEKIIAILECRSYSMRQGVHKGSLAKAFHDADIVIIKQPKLDWGIAAEFKNRMNQSVFIEVDTHAIISRALQVTNTGDHIVIMSNGGFDDIYEKLPAAVAVGLPS